MNQQQQMIGAQLRQWRQRRRMNQLDLAVEADISSRHLSFIETGRSKPSRATVMRLADGLDLPLRNRNALLLAAGFAPVYPERSIDHPSLASARETVQRIIDCHMPFPALAVDRHWSLIAANAAVAALLNGVAPDLLQPPVNVLRLSLHPDGLGRRIVNLAEWKHHLIERLRRQVVQSADPVLEAMVEELRAFPAPASKSPPDAHASIAIPLILDSPGGRLSLLSTTTIFGTPVEVTLSELAIESFFPADAETAERLRRI